MRLLFLLGLLCFVVGEGNEISEKIYQEIDAKPCVRLANKDGFIGCTSTKSGTSGQLYLIDDDVSYKNFIQKPPSEGRIILISSEYFTRVYVETLSKTKKVKGILVMKGNPPNFAGFSPAEPIPNKNFTLHPEVNFTWNPVGDSWMYSSFDFPIAAIASFNDSTRIRKYALKTQPRYGAELATFMWNKHDSITCIRRGTCDPIGGYSILSSLGPLDSRKKVLLVTRLDSLAFFHDLAVGAEADLSGLISVLVALDALSKLPSSIKYDKQIVIAFFEAESWGYIGSRRFVNDLSSNQLPFKISDISALLEFRQVGNSTDANFGSTLYAHKETSSGESNQEILKVLKQVGQQLDLPVVEVNPNRTGGIPPSSLMSFFRVSPKIPGIVVSDHDGPYRNKFFGSQFDGGNTIPSLYFGNIAKSASLIANVLLQLSIDNTSLAPEVNASLVTEIYYCLTQNYSCSLIKTLIPSLVEDLPETNYAGVYQPGMQPRLPVKFINDYVSYLFPHKTFPLNCSDPSASCSDHLVNGMCVASICLNSSTYLLPAYSLAFEFKDDIWMVVNKTGQEPLWTESQWDNLRIRVFTMNDPWTDYGILVIGLVEFVLSLVVIYYLKTFFEKRLKLY